MERLLTVLLAIALLGAGCLGTGEDGTTTDDDGQMPGGQERPALPATIQDEQQVTGSADPLNVAGGICQAPTAQCFEYPFTLNTTANLTATLTWGLEGSDFDLYLFSGEEQVAVSGAPPPGTEESLARDLSTGSYRLVVVAYAVTQDTFTIEGQFSYL